ncbi:MAG TPA: hypothetical protein PLW70_06510 [Bacteroidales bacterium]|nr:hypothetical protein [Bacteroidales bacterium]
MIKLEKFLGIAAVIGLILKLIRIPGSMILLILILGALAFLYYPFGFALFNRIGFRQIFKKKSYEGLSALRIIGSIGAGMAFSAICMGILFKIQRWAGVNLMLIDGLVPTFIILIIALIKYFKTKGKFYIEILKRTAIIGALGLLFFYTSTLTIVKIRFRNHPDYIKAYEMYLNNPEDEELLQKLNREYLKTKEDKEEVEMYPEKKENK